MFIYLLKMLTENYKRESDKEGKNQRGENAVGKVLL